MSHYMSTKAQEILNKFDNLVSHHSGPLDIDISGPAAWENPKDQCVIYALNGKALKAALENNCSLIICDKKLISELPERSDKCIFSCALLQVAMAKINKEFFPAPFGEDTFDGQKIHPTAVISETAKLGAHIIIGPNAIIDENTTIGDNCFIGAGTYVGKNTSIGNSTRIEAKVYIGPHCEIGNDCRVQALTAIGSDGYGYGSDEKGEHHFKVHYGKVVLHDRVEIGANVSIDRGAYNDSLIGEGTKIDNHCHLGHNFIIGKHCFVTAGFIAAGSTTIGDHCVFAGRCSMGGHLSIVSGCVFAGMSAVTKDITKPGAYGGYPVIPLKDQLRAMKSFAHLPELRKTVAKILKKVDINE